MIWCVGFFDFQAELSPMVITASHKGLQERDVNKRNKEDEEMATGRKPLDDFPVKVTDNLIQESKENQGISWRLLGVDLLVEEKRGGRENVLPKGLMVQVCVCIESGKREKEIRRNDTRFEISRQTYQSWDQT